MSSFCKIITIFIRRHYCIFLYINKRAKPAFCPPRIALQFSLAPHYITGIFLYINKRAKPAFCPPRIALQFSLAPHYITAFSYTLTKGLHIIQSFYNAHFLLLTSPGLLCNLNFLYSHIFFFIYNKCL